jgi:hypothetical protein
MISEEAAERFWAKVRKGDGCWLWSASFDGRGYGQFYCDGSLRRSHRVSFAIANGAIEPGRDICHTCDNPACVRPDHLFAGTRSENMRDSWNKGRNVFQRKKPRVVPHKRMPRGEQVQGATLTDEMVREMRDIHSRGFALKDIAAWYGKGYQSVRSAVIRETWKHVA